MQIIYIFHLKTQLLPNAKNKLSFNGIDQLNTIWYNVTKIIPQPNIFAFVRRRFLASTSFQNSPNFTQNIQILQAVNTQNVWETFIHFSICQQYSKYLNSAQQSNEYFKFNMYWVCSLYSKHSIFIEYHPR